MMRVYNIQNKISKINNSLINELKELSFWLNANKHEMMQKQGLDSSNLNINRVIRNRN